MRRAAAVLSLAVVVVLLAAGCGDVEERPRAEAERGLHVRVRGTIAAADDGAPTICPGGAPPCWSLDGPAPEGVDGEHLVVAEGRLIDDVLELDGTPTVVDRDPAFRNPCGAGVGTMSGGENGDEATVDAVGHYAEAIPDDFAGRWLSRPGPVVVLAVTRNADHHRAALARAGIDRGVCVTDDGFAFSERDLRRAQDDITRRWADWAANGWHAIGAGTDSVANRVTVDVDQADPRLRRELEDRWPGMTELAADVEVLEGTVQDLPVPPAGDIEIATRPRGVHLEALGTFTLRYDPAGNCLYLEVANGDRMKPVWPFGARALRDPIRVVGGDGKVIATVDESFQTGGGGGTTTGPDDPLACGATEVWTT